jgi:predicted HTH transcriptional regulator
MAQFIRRARLARGLPLPEEATPQELLTHLNLMDRENLTHAAVLLFGKQPQRFLLSSEVKCAHFHGLEVAKPIPSYQVYKGTVFDLVDQAVDFVMSKINLRVGTREGGPEAPVTYEIPREVVTEAIVNAVAHRDYTSAGSVQVMLFADRLEIWNPGLLPFSLTLAKLRQAHGSVPANPLLAEPLYLARYIERMGTGTGDMIRRCQEAGLPEPEFSLSDGFVVTLRRKAQRLPAPGTDEVTDQVTDEVTVEVQRLLLAFQGEMKRADILATLGLRHQPNFRDLYLHPALAGGWVEMTIPEKPNSSKQRYRLTRRGADLQATLRNKNLKP